MIQIVKQTKPETELYSIVEYTSALIIRNRNNLLLRSTVFSNLPITNDYISLRTEDYSITQKREKISSLRNRIKTKMRNEEIDQQIKSLRNEWQRDF